ncbi:response regulator transcription factor [Paenibacillus beijingensis]|uniref:Heme response regulator HssR n=1 Tax=Paenibacillus beijingensis TaxID=1126833 RepID=A0A0D5NMC2_9BACL|nr:response regulator transcription factor [Paenibacillus beijingensis]AJY76300.1 hypothetical protein VN24_19190 [Paenibacillus beijingensis]
MARILVVDDDPHIRGVVKLFLEREEYEIGEASDGIAALEKMEAVKYDLVILDIMMPAMDGWELCRQLRHLYDIPLLMLTVQAETTHKVKGFNLGTDDYMVKPFDPQELLVRVKALLKRYRIASSQTVQAGELVMNRKTFETHVAGQSVTLPLKEFELLFKLASYPGKTFTREQLIEDIWGYDHDGVDRTVDVHVNRLRQRFTDDEAGFTIRTIRGLGYRLEEQR